MAQYQEMSGAKKLGRPSFEKQDSGLELSVAGQQLKTGRAVKRIVRYELIIIDSNYKRFVKKFFLFSGALFKHFLKGNATARSPLSKKTRKQYQPFDDRIKVQQTGYSVATQSDNKLYPSGKGTYRSEAEAREYMQQQVAVNPSLKESLHVIPEHELNPA